MRLSDDRISYIAHLLVDGPWEDDLVDYTDEDMVLRETKRSIAEYFKIDDEIDNIVREKLKSYSRGIAEGGSEWEILYKKHHDEEMRKRFKS
jgi:uncharacterized protein